MTVTDRTLPSPRSPEKADKPALKDRYRPAPETGRRIAATVAGLGIFILAADLIGLAASFLAAAVVGYCIAEQVPTKTARTVALALAVWSHGPEGGVESDRCYPARAEHFARWIRTGENRRVVPRLPELGRWCAHCGAPEWCTASDGTVRAHDFQPASDS